MPIRPSGVQAARAAISFAESLRSLHTSDEMNNKIELYLRTKSISFNNIEHAIQENDEAKLKLALLAVPGSGYDFDIIGFYPDSIQQVKPSYDRLVHAIAVFFVELRPNLLR